MKIAQIAPLAESVPPRHYGGTERVVAYLTEELVGLGHDVTLFRDAQPHVRAMLERVRSRANEFDVLHFHVEPTHLAMFRPFARKIVTTLHSRLDLPASAPYREFDDLPLVSISDAQRRPLPHANWVATVHHGLPDPVCPYNPVPRGQYLAFLGGSSPEKGLERAIEIARRTGRRIEFMGEADEEHKPALLGNAAALLFPIDWPEPFGLAMIEAMSCGTPVIGWPNGSVPEVVEHGVTGFVVDSLEAAVSAVRGIERINRAQVRRRFEERFSAARMARDYLAVYRSLRTRTKEASV